MRDSSFYIGKIIEVLPNTTFRVVLDEHNLEIICHLSGKMRMNKIKCLLDDAVEVVLSQDKKLGRIVRRQ